MPLVLVLILSLPFVAVLVARPVLRRLAVRNAVRRPREAMLVIAGSLLGTAIMTGSFVVGDTFDASIRDFARTQLGPTDEVVAAVGLDAGDDLRTAFDGFGSPDVDGTLPVTAVQATAASTGENRLAAPKAQLLELDFAAAQGFGGDAKATGIEGETPGPDQTVITDDLAEKLGVGVGDEVDLFAYGAQRRMTVAGVLPQVGIAGLWLQRGTSSYNAFVAPGTIAELSAEATGPGEPPFSLMLVSNTGGIEDGAARSAAVEPLLTEQIDGLEANVSTVKADLLEQAKTSGDSLTQLYTALGAFAIAAGVLLLVNIFVMLAEERKSELGMLRAVGLRRASLVGAFATEGWMYALVSSVIGTFVGLALGRVIMVFAARIFSGGDDQFAFDLRFAYEWSSVLVGLVVGFAIAIVTVVLTSLRISRFNVIQAIRDIPETARHRPRRRVQYAGILLAALGVAMAVSGFSSGSAPGILLGPVLVLVGLAPVLSHHVPREVVATLLPAAVVAWGAASVPVAVARGGDIEIFMFVVQGLVLVGGSVVLISEHQDSLGRGLGRLFGGSLDLRLGLAYPLARKFRTAMTLAMFSLVVFILVYVSTLSAMFESQVDTFTADTSGGFDVVMESNPTNPIPTEAIAATSGVSAVAPLATVSADIRPAGDAAGEPVSWPLSGYDESLVATGAPTLNDRGDYPSDAAAYRAVLADPSLAIVDSFFISEGAGPPSDELDIGDRFTALDPASGREREFTVAAIGADDWVFNGGLIGQEAAGLLFGDRAVASRAYVAASDPEAFAAGIEGTYLENGAEAKTIRGIVDESLAQQQQFFLLMRGYLALGLLVGIAGIGVIMVRAVRERRRQVGVLRALGFQAKSVRRAFVIESGFVAVEGTLIGVAIGLLATWSITLTDSFGDDLAFTVPTFAIAVLALGTLFFAVLATAGPANAAARIRPAVALRVAD